MRTILVTGATGFVGTHLLRRLRSTAGDARLVGWGRTSDDLPGTDAAAWRAVDVTDRHAVMQAVEADRPDEVYHLAGAAHVGDSWARAGETLAINVLGTHHLLDGLRRHAPTARTLVTGSALIYRPSLAPLSETSALGPTSPYGLSKLAQERLALRAWADDAQAVIPVRAFNHIGPGQDPGFSTASFAKQIAEIEAGLRPPVLLVGNLDAERDLMDVRDTVDAYVALMASGVPGRPYNVCSGRAWPIKTVLHTLVAAARAPLTIRVDRKRLRPSDNPRVLGDAARLAADTGWTPTRPLNETLADVLDDWRRRIGTSG